MSSNTGIATAVHQSTAAPITVSANPFLLEAHDDLGAVRRRVKRGDYLFRAGAQAHAIYVVRSGFFKTALVAEDGREQIIGFQMRGDLLGLDAAYAQPHGCDAIALDDGEVTEITWASLEDAGRRSPQLPFELYRTMTAEIQREQSQMLVLGSMTAEERLANFLLMLSARFAAHGYSPRRFLLRMTRAEIGSFLGLKLETVSRMFSRFQDEGMVEVNQREIDILDMPRLRRVIGRRDHLN